MSAGQMSAFMPNTAKAKIAAESVFKLIDRTSRIDYSTGTGQKPDRMTVKGDANVEKAVFYYPTRPDIRVLDGLEVSAPAGKMIALVGPSGCGKSTIIALLERWYDLNEGIVKLDGIETKDWELCHLRSQISLVGQEPVLFNTSIREQIAYGSLQDTVSDEEIEKVAKMANIHEFIIGLPDGMYLLR